MKALRDFKTYHIEKLKNPSEARMYLSLALADFEKDNDIDDFLLAIRDVAQAQGGIGRLAHHTRLNRQNLYKALSKEGNPRLETIGAVLNGLGFRLSVEPLKELDRV
ncbi:MAG: putative addiction module antidote protein [bacterium]|nr:putative addiction module antidote protein [bacterium]